MIQIQVSYDMPRSFGFPDDERIESALRGYCKNLTLEGSGAGFGRRDLEFWADEIEPGIDLEYALEPLFLNNLEVTTDDEYDPDQD